MKKILLFAIATMLFSVSIAQNEFGQRSFEERKASIKERMETLKLEANVIDKKLMKMAKKEAKRIAKEGWEPVHGTLPLEVQLYKLYVKEYTMDGSWPKYIIGRDQAIGSSIGGAKLQAETQARVDIARQIGVEVAGLIENSKGNKEISDNDVSSITSTMSETQEKFSHTLKRTENAVQMFRKLDNGNYQFSMTVTYDGRMAKDDLLKIFEEKSADMKAKLEKLFESQ
ncbi:MAG: hypothetical protein Q4A15_04680 [Prevotellaceae bacterium]|nr:hypothetical protein [Prevotellaceae bacterium]